MHGFTDHTQFYLCVHWYRDAYKDAQNKQWFSGKVLACQKWFYAAITSLLCTRRRYLLASFHPGVDGKDLSSKHLYGYGGMVLIIFL